MGRDSLPPVVVLGAHGQLGSDLCRLLGDRAIPMARADLDITNPKTIAQRLKPLGSATVINTAAYTDVDQAETDRDGCWSVNVDAVKTLAEVCALSDCRLVQISSDYVFGGDKARTRPYTEVDPPMSVNFYGESKVAAEGAARTCPNHLIIRTCGLYGASPPWRANRSFPATILQLANQGKTLRVVNDQQCTPTYVSDVSTAIVTLLESKSVGTFHVTNSGSTTWYDFAQELLHQSQLDIELLPISTGQYGAAAHRPGFSVLDTHKYCQLDSGVKLPPWQDGIRRFLLRVASVA